MGVTLKDIANYCGVSSATVSMIINGKPNRISQDTIKKVEHAIKHLGYTPNIAARSMVTRKTKTIGLTIPDIGDYFFSELAKGVGDEVDKHGYDLLLGNTKKQLEKEQEYIHVFQGRSVDGIIFAPLNSGEADDLFPVLQNRNYPFVTIERYIEGISAPGVFMNNFQAAYDLTMHLTENGHKRIAFITGPLDTASAVQRFDGYKAALKRINIPFDPALVYFGDFSYESGEAAGNDLFNKGIDDVTALLASNNRMGLGFYQIAESHGLSVPQDISIAGIGGTQFHKVMRPKITTIDMPIYELGVKAAELLFLLLEGKKVEEKRVVFDLPLLKYGSVKNICCK